MVSLDFARKMPKVELHVHLEGSVRPKTVLELARKNRVELPATDLEGLREWYVFQDFRHFVEIYIAVSKCIKGPEDIEFITREFLEGQAEQNILHSEVTYTASTIESFNGISWAEQLDALTRARDYGSKELGVSCCFIIDIVRGSPVERGVEVAEWVVGATNRGVCALGLAGEEWRGTAEYTPAFEIARQAGVPVIPHAGETLGSESIWSVLEHCDPLRIGHGVRAIEDPALIDELRRRQIPLEVCPTSNVALGGYPTMEDHPLPKLLDAGLYVTLNSDDPPMFNTTLSEEYSRCAGAFDFSEDILWSLSQNAARACLLPEKEKSALAERMRTEFSSIST